MSEAYDELRKFVAPEILFGKGSLEKCVSYIRNTGGRKVLLVSDRGIENVGWTSHLENILNNAGISFVPFYDVTPNPKDTEIDKGVEVYLENGCDMLVALGGGSPIDCSKGIGIVVSNKKAIKNFEGVDKVEQPVPPLIAIPTTAGTSADVSQFAIITDTSQKYKMAIVSKGIVSDASIIDPLLSVTMDRERTAETGIDALSHAFEAYVSNATSSLTDLHAEKAVEYIIKNLKRAVESPDDIQARTGMMQGSLHAGLAFSNASLGLIHSMSHALGGFYDLSHGYCNGMLFEPVVKYNFEAEPERYRKLAEMMIDKDLSEAGADEVLDLLVDSITDLKKEIGIRTSLDSKDISPNVLEKLAEKAIQDACTVTNPMPVTEKDIISIYEKLLR